MALGDCSAGLAHPPESSRRPRVAGAFRQRDVFLRESQRHARQEAVDASYAICPREEFADGDFGVAGRRTFDRRHPCNWPTLRP